MRRKISATLASNGDAVSFSVRSGEKAVFDVVITATYTVSLTGQSGAAVIDPVTGSAAAWTASEGGIAVANPGTYTLTGSNDTGGQAVITGGVYRA